MQQGKLDEFLVQVVFNPASPLMEGDLFFYYFEIQLFSVNMTNAVDVGTVENGALAEEVEEFL